MKVVRREGVETAKRELRARIRADWNKRPDLKRFLEDHFPEAWSDIQGCGMKFREWKDRDNPSRRKLQPFSCHHVPYCITCSRLRTARRVADALDSFHRCTPAGQRPRFIHIVQTAPLTSNGRGWGLPASQNHRTFVKIVWQTLQEAYGDGLGGVLSYQDFGERGFAKRHPHVDLTLNGWRLKDGKPERTPQLKLRHGGAHRFQEALAKRAMTFDVEATEWEGNLKVQAPVLTAPEYYRVLRYQMRELLDFKKLGYSRERQVVWWMSYKHNRRQKMTVPFFLNGLQEYQARLGPWSRHPGEGRQNLHFRYGHMADTAIGRTERLVEGSPIPHGKRCPCSDCGDWERVLEEEE